MKHDRYEEIKQKEGLNDTDLNEKGIFPIHPAFRIVAVSEPPVIGSSAQQWMTSETLTMFLYHQLRPLSQAEELDVLHKLVSLPRYKEMITFELVSNSECKRVNYVEYRILYVNFFY